MINNPHIRQSAPIGKAVVRPFRKSKNILVKNLMSILAALIVPASVFAQTNFSYTPEKPKPGDEVKFTYTPSGDLTGIIQIPEAFVIKDSSNWMSIENVTLQRESGKLTGSIKTDTSYTFMALSFKDGDVYDNNNNEGYVLNFYQGDKVKKNSYARTAYFFSFYGHIV